MIVAIGQNNEIGKNNNLLWRLSDDLKRFKSITTGHTIVMGRKTFESLPKGALPNRRNIVLSNNKIDAPNIESVKSINELYSIIEPNEQVFIIGGASLYKLFLNTVNHLYLTEVEYSGDADTFFPTIDRSIWVELEKIVHKKDEKNEYDYTYSHLIRS
ncbi:MAG: dihydrofolate reductase [Bacteroidales bacterium]|nr:dihydrofolate reductase [Bacteroidales bacterium]